MTSKNSFLVRLFENGKRRLWLYVVAILMFMVAEPIGMAMEISLIHAMEEAAGFVRMQEMLYEEVVQMFTFNGGSAFVAGLFAVLSGIQGFSYLYDRSKIDFYHSKPVKTSRRFITIWTNGVIAFVIPYLFGRVIKLILAAVNGALDMAVLGIAGENIVLALGFYLCIYSITILAVMLTGKMLVTLMGVGVFLLYEMAVKSLFVGVAASCFHFFYGYDGSNDWFIPWFSPFFMLDRYWDEKWGLALTFLMLLLLAAAVLALAYWCYKKRPSELVGSAMTFRRIQPVIKIGISIPVAIVAGFATAGMMEYDILYETGSPFFPILLGVLFLVLTNALIQVIFEADIRGMFHKKRDIVISAVLTIVIVAVFRYDLAGYDKKIPALNKIESVSIITETANRHSQVYFDEKGKALTKEEYTDKYMLLTGEDAENVRNLALYSMEEYKKYPNRQAFYDAHEETSYVTYKFRLKNGRVMMRQIPIAHRTEEARALINKIEASENFVKANEPAMSDYLMQIIENGDYKMEASWGNEIDNKKLTKAQAKELLTLYREDLLAESYKVKESEIPIGRFEIYLDLQVSYYQRNLPMLIYPSYKNCVGWLEANGFETEDYIDVEKVDRIVVSRYYETGEETLLEEHTTIGFSEVVATYADGETVTADYVDRQKIEEIAEVIYPCGMEYEYWYQKHPYEELDYRVMVYFKEGTDYFDEYGSVADFYFLNDMMPDFVLEDLPLDAPPQK